MTILYVIAIITAIALAPAVVFHVWNGSARIRRRRAARLTILPVLATLAGCNAGGLLIAQEAGAGGEPTTSSASDTCSLAACPAGSFTSCEAADTTAPCCQGSAPFAVCSRAAGILVHSPACDAVCPTRECALAASGALVCCAFGDDGGAGPCDVAVDGGGK